MIISDINQKIQALKQELTGYLQQETILKTVEELEIFELSLHKLTSEIADLIVADKLQKTWDSPEFREADRSPLLQ